MNNQLTFFCFAVISLIIATLSCDDSDYPMDNWIDIPLQTMTPPAVFFNPHEVNVSAGDTFSINLYALEVENVFKDYIKKINFSR